MRFCSALFHGLSVRCSSFFASLFPHPLFVFLFFIISLEAAAQELRVLPASLPVIRHEELLESDFQFENRLADVFEITLSEFTKVQISASSETIDTALYLLDRQTGELHYNDDKNGLDAGIDISLNPGEYWIGVTSAKANTLGSYTLSVNSPLPQVYFIVDKAYLNEMRAEVERFVDDVSADTNTLGSIIEAPTDPIAIRTLLRQAWIEDDLVGSFLIGNVTPVNERVSDGFNDSSILSDHYYRALDCPYAFDSDSLTAIAKVNFSRISRCNSNIWLSRIYPSKSGREGLDQVKSYFDKNRLRRRDQVFYKPQMMFQPSTPREDRRNYEEFLSPIFSSHSLYALDDVQIEQNDNANIQKARFEEAIGNNYEILNLNIHGSSQVIQFQGLGFDELIDVPSTDLADLEVNAKILEFTSCNVGEFTAPGYFAGEALFRQDSLLVSAFAALVEIRVEDFITARMNTRYRALGHGLTYAEAYRFTAIGTLEHLFGDPTIALRENTIAKGDSPVIELAGQRYNEPFKYALDMGIAKHNETLSRAVLVKNSGSKDLVLEGISGNTREFGYAGESPMVNGLGQAIEREGFVFQLDLTASIAESEIEFTISIPPGQTAEIVFQFTPSFHASDPANALFTGLHRFRTNDPNVPLFHVNISGSHSVGAIPPPIMHGKSSDGSVTTSVFGGGASHSEWNSIEEVVNSNLPVDLGGVLIPEESHVGRLGNIYLYAHVSGEGWFALDSQGETVFLGKGITLAADRDLANQQSIELKPSHQVELVNDLVLAGSGLQGKRIGLVLAYSIGDEDILYSNEKPFEFTVE